MSARRDRAAVVGIGAAACAVCCAGPILGLLAAIGLGTAAGFALLFGVLALAIAVATGVVLYFRRRRRRTTCTPGQEVVQVEPPRVRAARGVA